MNSLQRFSVWFRESSASIRPTTRTKHTGDTQQFVLVRAIDKMNEAHFLAIDELRRSVMTFRAVFADPLIPRYRQRTLDHAWAVFRARRTLRNVEKAISRLHTELAQIRDPDAPVISDPNASTANLRAVAAA